MQRKGRRVRTAFAFAMAAVWSLLPFSVNAAQYTEDATGKTVQIAEVTIPDLDRKGSLTIHKYDITAAEKAGVYQKGQIQANGQPDLQVEEKLAAYAVEGVQFTCLRTGDMEVYSRTVGSESEVQLVYEIPEELREILGMSRSEAVDMQQEGLKYTCHATDVCHYTSTQLAKTLQQKLESDNVGTKDALEAYLYAYGRDDDNGDGAARQRAFSLPKTDARGETKAKGLMQGLYLVVETEVPEMVTDTVDPWLISLPFTDISPDDATGGTTWLYDVVCYPKNQTGYPTLDKQVRQAGTNAYGDTATASEGDVLEYTLVSRLPQITSKATYLNQYAFTDRLSQGLSYNRDVQIAIYKNAEDAGKNTLDNAVEIWDWNSELYRVSYEAAAQDLASAGSMEQMTVEMTEKGLQRLNGADTASPTDAGKNFGGLYMVVYYTATLHADATTVLGDAGNPNDVTLTWSRTSGGYSDTLEDRSYVYTYGVELQKTFSPENTETPLTDQVQFRMYNSTDGYYLVAERKETDGVYYVKSKTREEAEATLFVPATDGRLWICGIEGDGYTLTEVKTADGYQLLKEPVEVEIRATGREVSAATVGHEGKTPMSVGDIQTAGAAVNGQEAEMVCDKAMVSADAGSEHALVQLAVINTRGFLLPLTGGRGLYLVTILGVLAAGTGCMLLRKKD